MKGILPVITLYQPWATWIMRKWKSIETRTHTRFLSLKNKTILIHAGMTSDDSGLAVENPYLTHRQLMHDPEEMINGFILGSAFVSDFKPLGESHSKLALIDCRYTQRYGLFLIDVKKFEIPIPCKGKMGIWYYDLDKKEKVKKNSVKSLKLF